HLRGLRDATGPFSEKRRAMLKVKEQLDYLVKMDPQHTGYQRRMAETCQRLGSLEQVTGTGRNLFHNREIDVSLYDPELLERARSVQQKLVDAGQELPWVAVDLTDTLNVIACFRFYTTDDLSYRECDTRSVEILEEMVHEFPDLEKLHITLAIRLAESAKRDMSRSEFFLAAQLFVEAAKYYRQFLIKRPHDIGTRLDLGETLILAGRCYEVTGEQADSAENFAAAQEVLQQLKRLGPCPKHLQHKLQQFEEALNQGDSTE
ncbi:MAG: hypothetical protein KDB27_27455, partial [Planctomycetales bacterium]|nr:hypothetical protein [Planctomycetales bacterium]